MNLYNLHTQPELLHKNDERLKIPEFAIDEILKMDSIYEQRNNTDLIKVVSTDAESAYTYAYKVLQDRFEMGEEAIAKSAEYSVKYAMNIIWGRWLPGEAIIATDARASYNYCRNVIKGPWKQGEDAIMKNPGYAYDYAYVFKQERWLEAEKYIKQSETDWNAYKTAFNMGVDE